ncbi:MAG: serine/threonine protein kinase [Sandaracinaceae bacterium]|nr:serine/threonine protein kinase [Sandaracinaceae bacterium]
MSEDEATPTREESDPRIGTVLDGRYRLIRRLGAGGFGVVYEAEHEVIRRKVAVKMLHASFAADPELMARFRREAIAATTIGHPHIVEVLDMGRADDGAAYMALELLEGRDWAHVLEESGPQPLGRTVHILVQVLDGLAAAHDKGIVHRDLKAENVFLITRGDDPDFVKIVDFGISKIVEQGGGKDVVLTRTGAAMGTPVAMSPEQFQGKKDVDHRSDLWAIGVMLYRALTARWPFTGETYAMLAVNVMTEQPTALEELRPDLPASIGAIALRLLEKDRSRRFASAREVRAALEPFLSNRDPVPASAPPLVSTRIGIETPSELALAATGFALSPPSPPPPPSGSSATTTGDTLPTRGPSGAVLVGGVSVGAVLLAAMAWWASSGGPPGAPEVASEPTRPDAAIAVDAAVPSLDAIATPASEPDAAHERRGTHRDVRPAREAPPSTSHDEDVVETTTVPTVTAQPPPTQAPPPTTEAPPPPPTTTQPTPPGTSRPGFRRPGALGPG